MANKKATPEVVETVAQKLERLKAEQAAARTEIATLQAQADAEAQKLAEENRGKREKASEKLASLIVKGLEAVAKSNPLTIIAVTHCDALVASLEAIKEGSSAKLKEAHEALASIPGYKAPRKGNGGPGSRNGEPKEQTSTVTLAQKRVLTYLNSLGKDGSASRHDLVCVAQSHPFGTSPSIAKIGGDCLGNVRDENNAHPYSLLSRGWIKADSVMVDGKSELRLSLTDEGRKNAEQFKVELKHDYSKTAIS
jgi:hypothetical protein